jgi:ELWxxDGT repeat protein
MRRSKAGHTSRRRNTHQLLEPLEWRVLLSTQTADQSVYDEPLMTNFVEDGGQLLFFNNDGIHGLELWKSDGSQQGTALIKDINPGPKDSANWFFLPLPGTQSTINGTTYFTATDGVHGFELWKSDGTTAGTMLVCDTTPGPFDSLPYGFTAARGQVFFFTEQGDLWKTDGTRRGTAKLATVEPSRFVLGTHSFAALGDTFYCINSAGELWKSQGTLVSTSRIATVSPLVRGSLYAAAGRLFILDVGTGDVSTLNPDNRDITPIARLAPGTEFIPIGDVNGHFLFSAAVPPANGQSIGSVELWITDGSLANTSALWTSSTDTYWSASDFIRVGNAVFFTAQGQGGVELWKSDGTSSGTVAVTKLTTAWRAQDFVDVKGTLYFNDLENLWKSDGSAAGTAPVAPLPTNPMHDMGGSDYTAVGDRLYFSGLDSNRGHELYVYNPDSPRRRLRRITAFAPTVELHRGRLTIGGTSFVDTIRISADAHHGRLNVDGDGFATKFNLAAVGAVSVSGESGDDIITLIGPVPHATLNGGGGHDVLSGGDGDDYFIANDRQSDSIQGGKGKDSGRLDRKDIFSSIEQFLA